MTRGEIVVCIFALSCATLVAVFGMRQETEQGIAAAFFTLVGTAIGFAVARKRNGVVK